MSQLVDYGIQNEKSDLRAHVCPKARRVYVFRTEDALAVTDTGRYIQVQAYQPGWEEPTATGYLVPPFDIPNCVSVTVRPCAWERLNFSDADNLSTKGRKAMSLVSQMIRRGLFPLPFFEAADTSLALDINGEDITVTARSPEQQKLRIQVKCDYPGGEKELGGSGNLFLQISECNPLGIH